MTIASAQGRGLDIENFSEVETAAFLKAFNALKPESNFVATKMFAAVGRDRAYVFFESGKDLCTTPSPRALPPIWISNWVCLRARWPRRPCSVRPTSSC